MLVWAFSVIVQLHRLSVYSTTYNRQIVLRVSPSGYPRPKQCCVNLKLNMHAKCRCRVSELGVANSRVPAHTLHTITKYGTRAAVNRLPWRLLKPDATAQTLSPLFRGYVARGFTCSFRIFDLPFYRKLLSSVI